MRAKYITIEREYGSGGTKIARMLAEKSKVPCYGKEILERVSEKYNLSMDEIQHYEESVTNSLMYSIFMMTQVSSGKADMLTKEGHIFVAEQSIIRSLAETGPAIFLGHCASEALKDKSGVINVFIHCSDKDAKKKRILSDYGISADAADTTMKRFDKKRANYYYAPLFYLHSAVLYVKII